MVGAYGATSFTAPQWQEASTDIAKGFSVNNNDGWKVWCQIFTRGGYVLYYLLCLNMCNKTTFFRSTPHYLIIQYRLACISSSKNMDCTLKNNSFRGEAGGGAYLDSANKCHVCGKFPGHFLLLFRFFYIFRTVGFRILGLDQINSTF